MISLIRVSSRPSFVAFPAKESSSSYFVERTMYALRTFVRFSERKRSRVWVVKGLKVIAHPRTTNAAAFFSLAKSLSRDVRKNRKFAYVSLSRWIRHCATRRINERAWCTWNDETNSFASFSITLYRFPTHRRLNGSSLGYIDLHATRRTPITGIFILFLLLLYLFMS